MSATSKARFALMRDDDTRHGVGTRDVDRLQRLERQASDRRGWTRARTMMASLSGSERTNGEGLARTDDEVGRARGVRRSRLDGSPRGCDRGDLGVAGRGDGDEAAARNAQRVQSDPRAGHRCSRERWRRETTRSVPGSATRGAANTSCLC